MDDELDGEPLPVDQARLLAALGRALGPDEVPASLVERASELIALKDLDAALVALLEESGAEPAGLRGGADAAGRLQFEQADGSVAVELVPERDRLVGQVLAGELTVVALESRSGVVATTAIDELGRFAFDRVANGPTRLRLAGSPAARLTTDWFLL